MNSKIIHVYVDVADVAGKRIANQMLVTDTIMKYRGLTSGGTLPRNDYVDMRFSLPRGTGIDFLRALRLGKVRLLVHDVPVRSEILATDEY